MNQLHERVGRIVQNSAWPLGLIGGWVMLTAKSCQILTESKKSTPCSLDIKNPVSYFVVYQNICIH